MKQELNQAGIAVKPLGGSISSILRRMIKGENANPPCGSCVACCHSFQSIKASPGDDLSVFVERDGEMVLPTHPESQICAYLIDGKCTIYEKRPQVCRKFDCRIYPIAFLRFDKSPQSALIKKASSAWDVTSGIKTVEDAKIADSIELSTKLAPRFDKDGKPFDIEQMAGVILNMALNQPSANPVTIKSTQEAWLSSVLAGAIEDGILPSKSGSA